MADIIELAIAGATAVFFLVGAFLASYDRVKGAVIAALIGMAMLVVGRHTLPRPPHKSPAVSAKE